MESRFSAIMNNPLAWLFSSHNSPRLRFSLVSFDWCCRGDRYSPGGRTTPSLPRDRGRFPWRGIALSVPGQDRRGVGWLRRVPGPCRARRATHPRCRESPRRRTREIRNVATFPSAKTSSGEIIRSLRSKARTLAWKRSRRTTVSKTGEWTKLPSLRKAPAGARSVWA